MIFWYLSLGNPSVCLANSSHHAIPKAPKKTSLSINNAANSMHQLSKEIKKGNTVTIKEILKSSKHLINQLDESGKSPLMLAIASRNTKVVQFLLAHFSEQINFDLTDLRNHATALDYANFVETKHIYNMLIPYY